MQRTATLIVVVGIFFVVGVILLFGLSLRATGPSVSGGYTLVTRVNDARGLEQGAEVTRAGVPVGVVKSIELSKEEFGKVRVTMEIMPDVDIKKDSVASIRMKSLLGTYYVHLSHGTQAAANAQAEDVLVSEETVNIDEVMRTVAKLGEEAGGVAEGARDLLANIDKNQADFFDRIDKVIEQNGANITTVTQTLADSAPQFRRIMQDLDTNMQRVDGVIDRVDQFFSSAGDVATSLNKGEGTLGKLLKEDEVYESVRSAAANIDEVSQSVRAGEGTLGRLLYDEQMATKLDETFDNVNSASKSLKDVVEGNSEKLANFMDAISKVTPDIEETFGNFVEISKKVNEGEGTLGKLVNDPELYDEVRRTVTQIRRTFEEGEEQSVLRTFLGVFFGAMI